MRRSKLFVPGTAGIDVDHEPEALGEGRAAYEDDVEHGSLQVRGAGEVREPSGAVLWTSDAGQVEGEWEERP